MKRLALALCLLPLAACDSAPGTAAGETGGQAEGEVLGGTISDDMIALEQLTSRAPLAPRAGPSASEVDAQQPQVAGEMAPTDAPADAPVESAPAAAPAASQ
ncbi:MAG: hypothetical protein ACJLS3_15275 [Erythrobacter sp.]